MMKILASFDRPRRIRRPLAPGSGIELRALDARVLEREQIVTGSDAGTAVAHDVIRRDLADHIAQLCTQIFWRAKCAGGIEVSLKEVIRCAGDVAGGLVYRLGLTAVAFRRARVDEA